MNIIDAMKRIGVNIMFWWIVFWNKKMRFNIFLGLINQQLWTFNHDHVATFISMSM